MASLKESAYSAWQAVLTMNASDTPSMYLKSGDKSGSTFVLKFSQNVLSQDSI